MVVCKMHGPLCKLMDEVRCSIEPAHDRGMPTRARGSGKSVAWHPSARRSCSLLINKHEVPRS